MAYVFRRAVLSALFLTTVSFSALQAQNTVKGRVTDSQGEPIPGANITLRQKSLVRATQSDMDGYYQLRDIPSGNASVEATHVVYQPEKRFLTVSGIETENFELKENVVLMDEVVISATRAGEEDPFAQTVVSSEELQRNNFGQNIPFLLGGTPSLVFTSDDGTGYGYSYMRIRGSDATRVNVTINDVPLNDAESQSVFWVNLPNIAASANDIQIQRGAGTSTNGAAAFGGSVNIRTSLPSDKAGADLSYNVGSFGAQKFSAAFTSGLLNDHYELSGRFSRAYSDGYIDRASSDMSSYFLSGGYYDNRTTIKVLGFGGKQTTYQAWNGVDAETMKTNRRFNSCGAIYDENWEKVIGYYDDETDNYWQDHLQAIFNRRMGDFEAGMTLHYTFGRGYYESYKQDADMARYKIGPITVGDQTIETCDLINRKWLYNHFYGATARLTYDRKKITATLSGAYNRYEGDHYGEVIWAQYTPDAPKDQHYYDNHTDKNDGNVFLKAEYRPVEGLSIYADLQYRNVTLKMRGMEDEDVPVNITRDYSFFNPKAGVSYRISAAHRVYASYARASKEPTRADFTGSAAPRIPRRFRTGIRLYLLPFRCFGQRVLHELPRPTRAHRRTERRQLRHSDERGQELPPGYRTPGRIPPRQMVYLEPERHLLGQRHQGARTLRRHPQGHQDLLLAGHSLQQPADLPSAGGYDCCLFQPLRRQAVHEQQQHPRVETRRIFRERSGHQLQRTQEPVSAGLHRPRTAQQRL